MIKLRDFNYLTQTEFENIEFRMPENNHLIGYINHIIYSNIRSINISRYSNKSFRISLTFVEDVMDLSELVSLGNDVSIEFVQNEDNIRFNNCKSNTINIYGGFIELSFYADELPIFSSKVGNTKGEEEIDN